ncbi:MAG: HEAT repeat domain-containing protein [Planctomycetes bacterium]|nr:HEAT repeat domain-containing protein [Planctomycetota bacterium]
MRFISLFIAVSFLPCLQQNNENPEQIRELINQVSSKNPRTRSIASERLIHLWKTDSIIDRINESISNAKNNNDSDAISRLERIYNRIQFNRAVGDKLASTIRSEDADDICSGNEQKILEYFQKWIVRPKNYGLDARPKQDRLIKWVFNNLNTQDALRNFLYTFTCIAQEVSSKQDGLSINRLEILLEGDNLNSIEKFLNLVVDSRVVEMTDKIATLVNHDSPRLRFLAINILDSFSAKEYYGEIADRLGDPNTEVRLCALKILVKLTEDDYRQKVLMLLNDPELEVRATLISWLWYYNGREIVKNNITMLSDLLKSSDIYIIKSGLEIIDTLNVKQFHKEIAGLLKHSNQEVCIRSLLVLKKIGAHLAEEEISGLLLSDDPTIKIYTIGVLETLRSAKCAKKIAKLLKDHDANVRTTAIRTLGNLEAKEFVNDIAELLNDGNLTIRLLAAESLTLLNSQQHSKEISKFLKDEELTSISKQIIMALLVRLNAKECIDDIAVFLKEEDPWSRCQAVWALGNLNAVKFADEIKKLSSDETTCTLWIDSDSQIKTTINTEVEDALRKFDSDKTTK